MRRLLFADARRICRNAHNDVSFCLLKNVLMFYQSYRTLERGLMIRYPALEKREDEDKNFRKEVRLHLL